MKLKNNNYFLFIYFFPINTLFIKMGCKCTNSNEEEEEIKQREITDGNLIGTEPKNQKNDAFINNHNNNIFFRNKQNYDETNLNNLKNLENSNEFENEQLTSNLENTKKESYNSKYLNYSEKIVELINNIRQDPVSYADVIEESIQNIIEDNNKNDSTKSKIIYKQKIKVALTRGEPAFHEAAEVLRNFDPLPPLEFVSDLCIPLPENEEEMRDPTFLKTQVKKMRDEGIFIDVFFKDLVKIPEVSSLLMIVDDSSKNAGKKRLALLNNDFKYIGVNSKFIGKTFIAYLAFAK